jgi:hypothetical protein
MHQYDDKTVCIFDKFPKVHTTHSQSSTYTDLNLVRLWCHTHVKAFKHLLVLPRRLIPGYSHLTGDDVPLLKEMQKRGEMTIEQYSLSVPIAASCSACDRCVDRVLMCRTAIRLTSRYGTLKFRLGFHAVPSMRQIHVCYALCCFCCRAARW